jgi:hypothetical protein
MFIRHTNMTTTVLKDVENCLDKVSQAVWKSFKELNTTELVDRLERLLVQVSVLKDFTSTTDILQSTKNTEPLPKNQAYRVKAIIDYAYLKHDAPRGNDYVKRQQSLRQLDIDGLKFFGLCFKIKTMQEMPLRRLMFILQLVPEYVKINAIAPYLDRQDINSHVNKTIWNGNNAKYDESYQKIEEGMILHTSIFVLSYVD